MNLQERDLEYRGLRVHLWEGGSGFPILLLHGSGPGASTLGNWRAVLEPLASHYHVIAADLVGFGLSDRKPEPPYFDFDLWLGQAGFLLGQFHEDRVGLIGHSLSGAIALKLAARERRVSHVLTTGTMGTRFRPNADTELVWTFPADREALQRTAEVLIHDRALITDEYLDNRMKVLHSGDYEAYFSSMFSGDKQRYVDAALLADEELAAIGARVLMIHGRQDTGFPFEETTLQLARHLPDADVLALGRCRHSPALEHPDKFMQAARTLFG